MSYLEPECENCGIKLKHQGVRLCGSCRTAKKQQPGPMHSGQVIEELRNIESSVLAATIYLSSRLAGAERQDVAAAALICSDAYVSMSNQASSTPAGGESAGAQLERLLESLLPIITERLPQTEERSTYHHAALLALTVAIKNRWATPFQIILSATASWISGKVPSKNGPGLVRRLQSIAVIWAGVLDLGPDTIKNIQEP